MVLLQKTYPFHSKTKYHLLIALGFAIWVFIFLFFIKPLTVDTLNIEEQLFFLPIYGLISGISYCPIIIFQNIIYKKQKQHWFLYNEVFILFVLSIISLVLIWFFFRYIVTIDDPKPFPFYTYLTSIFLPALFIIIPLISASRFFLGKYQYKNKEKIKINGTGNYEHLQLFLEDLLYIKSSNNYVEVFYLYKEEIKTSVIRNNLSKIEEENSQLLKIHRSFLINALHYKEWRIEKNKHFIILHHSIKLPVSKTYLESTKSTLNFATK